MCVVGLFFFYLHCLYSVVLSAIQFREVCVDSPLIWKLLKLFAVQFMPTLTRQVSNKFNTWNRIWTTHPSPLLVAGRKMWLYSAALCKQLLKVQFVTVGLFTMTRGVGVGVTSIESWEKLRFESRLISKHFHLYTSSLPSYWSVVKLVNTLETFVLWNL